MARYIPKHRRPATLAERRRTLGVAALAVSSVVGLSGTYGFVPGVQAVSTSPPSARDRPLTGVGDTGASATDGASPSTDASETAAAAIRPAYVDIETIGTTSSLIPLSLRDDGTLNVPEVASQAGWYAGGVAPGEPGPAIIVGHVDSYLGSAVFSRLHELKPGDLVRVARVDGTVLTFSVRRIDQYPKDLFPTDLVYGSTTKRELRLITCGGTFNRSAGSYRDNVVVYADLLPV